MTPNKLQVEIVVNDGSEPSYTNEKHDNVIEVEKSKLDEGAIFLNSHPEYSGYTEADEKRLKIKLDVILIPILTIAILVSAADKIILSNASLYGMSVDLNLKNNQYSWAGSIFFFGYLIMEPLANFLLQRYRIGKVLGITYTLWSIIMACMGATHNFAGIASLRFVMGMGEAFIFPGVNAIIAMFYTKKELPIRLAIVFSALSSLLSNGVAVGIGERHTLIAPWRLLFIVLGVVSFVLGILLIAFVPDSPTKTYLLTEKEKYIAVSRMQHNGTGIKNSHFKKYQLMEALTDWKTWVAALMVLAIQVPNGALVTFASQIVSGLGNSKRETLLLGMPTGVFMSVASLLIALGSYLLRYRYVMILSGVCMLVPLVCCVLIMKLKDNKHLLVCYYFFYFYWGPYPLVLSTINNNTSGYTKKTAVNTICFISYCVANIIAPQFFISSEEPAYPTGYRALLAFLVVSVLTSIAYSVGCYLENQKRDRLYGVPTGETDENDNLDITDHEKKYFRYVF